jgi:hypothetical protein
MDSTRSYEVEPIMVPLSRDNGYHPKLMIPNTLLLAQEGLGPILRILYRSRGLAESEKPPYLIADACHETKMNPPLRNDWRQETGKQRNDRQTTNKGFRSHAYYTLYVLHASRAHKSYKRDRMRHSIRFDSIDSD